MPLLGNTESVQQHEEVMRMKTTNIWSKDEELCMNKVYPERSSLQVLNFKSTKH